MMKTYFDSRWIGDHGIGRFARVLSNYLDLEPLPIKGKPSSPFDPFRMFFVMLLKTPRNACVLSPGYNAPLFVVRPFIFTILDLNHIDRPENSSFFKRLYYRIIMKRAAHKAFKVLTISEFSRQRIIEWSGLDPDNVVNVSCGVDSNYNQNVKPCAFNFPYILCVSNRRPHKNEPRIIEAFATSNINTDILLVFTGPPSDTITGICRQFGIEKRVSFLGRVPEDDLPGLYRGALILLFPSLYEGFGLPVIEAMACGTPVVTSNTTSLLEIAGDAALLVNPLSVKEISTGIERLCSDYELRESIRNKGYEQAALYSWDNVAARVNKVMNELENIRYRP